VERGSIYGNSNRTKHLPGPKKGHDVTSTARVAVQRKKHEVLGMTKGTNLSVSKVTSVSWPPEKPETRGRVKGHDRSGWARERCVLLGASTDEKVCPAGSVRSHPRSAGEGAHRAAVPRRSGRPAIFYRESHFVNWSRKSA